MSAAGRAQKPRKRAKVIYKDDPAARAAELEEFLFGAAKTDVKQVFAQRVEESEDDDATLTDLVQRSMGGGSEANADQLFFFEDRAGRGNTSQSAGSKRKGSGSDDDGSSADEEEESEDEMSEEEESDKSGGRESDQEGSSDDTSSKSESLAEHISDDEEDEEDQPSAKQILLQQKAALKAARAAVTIAGNEAASKGGKPAGGKTKKGGPVWEDPADAQISVSLASKARLRKLRTDTSQDVVGGQDYEAALRKKHAELHPRTQWAAVRQKGSRRAGATAAAGDEGQGDQEEEEEDELQELAAAAMPLVHAGRTTLLLPGTIETTRVKDANQAEPCQGVVRSVGFHPGNALLLTGSLDNRIRLFQIDGVNNPKVQSVYLESYPVHKASWAAGGAQIIAAGQRKFFYSFDVAAGRIERLQQPAGCQLNSLERFACSQGALQGGGPSDSLLAFMGDEGYIPLMSLSSRQWVGNLKMSGGVRQAAFVPGTHEFLSLGGDGIVYTWDLRMRRVMSQMRDHANVSPSALAVSPDGAYLSTGSGAGVVNVYQRHGSKTAGGLTSAAGVPLKSPPVLGGAASQGRPLKEIMNLTTEVDSLVFSHDSQVMAMASTHKKDAMRLVHLPSATVFSNWPTSRSPLQFVTSLAFSPHSGFLAIGNARGRVLLYRMHHYGEI